MRYKEEVISSSFASFFDKLLKDEGISSNNLAETIKSSDGFKRKRSQGVSPDSIDRYRKGKALPQNEAWILISNDLTNRRVSSERIAELDNQLKQERKIDAPDAAAIGVAGNKRTGGLVISLIVLVCVTIAVFHFSSRASVAEPVWQDDAEVVSVEGWPKKVIPGEQFDIQIKVRNIGTHTWRRNVEDKCPYVLGFGDGSKGNSRYMQGSAALTIQNQPHGNEHGAPNLLTLANDREVLPQKEVTFSATLRVMASKKGVYPIVFRMLRNGKPQADGQAKHPFRTWTTGWFGEIKSENQVVLDVVEP